MSENLSLEEIKKQYGKNKRVPKHLEELFYSVIVYYPELKDTYLIVVETKFYGTQHTLRAYPPLLSLPNKRKDRVYPIVINLNKDIPLSFYNLSLDQKKGILSHELAHILDYTTRTSPQILGMCFRFLFSGKYIRDMEHATDTTAISRSCAGYLFLYRTRLLQTADSNYAKYISATYLMPEQILEKIKDDPSMYSENFNPVMDKNYTPIMPTEKSFLSRTLDTIINALSFFPAITEMMVLVYVNKIHKKSDWYS